MNQAEQLEEWGFADGETDGYQGDQKVQPEPGLPQSYWDAYDLGFQVGEHTRKHPTE